MKKTKLFLTSLFSVLLLTTSCDKEESPAPAPAPVAPKTVSPNYPANQGLLQLVNSVSIVKAPFVGEIATDVYTAVAVISDGSGSYINAGDITVEGKKLAKQAGNSYVYTNLTNPITPEGSIDWTISGGAGFAAANTSTSNQVPKLVTITKPTEINLAGGYIRIDSQYESEILVVLASGSKSVVKYFPRNTTIAYFSQAELAELTATKNGFVQITPYNYVVKTINGKDIVIGNQTTYSYQGVEFVD